MTSRFGIENEAWDKITGLFAKNPKIKKAVLFGSRAKGNARTGSDIDLALFGDGLDSTDLAKLERDYEDLYLPWKFDVLIYDKVGNVNLKDHIDRVGVVVYENRPI